MTTMDSNGSNRELERLRDGIDAAWEEARKFGLDPFPTHFELVPASIMYEFASYSLPGRFSHWTHGKSYYRQKMQYDLGLSKIYEMVVNTNPSYAFLMDMNDLLQNTFVAAHVLVNFSSLDPARATVWILPHLAASPYQCSRLCTRRRSTCVPR